MAPGLIVLAACAAIAVAGDVGYSSSYRYDRPLSTVQSQTYLTHNQIAPAPVLKQISQPAIVHNSVYQSAPIPIAHISQPTLVQARLPQPISIPQLHASLPTHVATIPQPALVHTPISTPYTPRIPQPALVHHVAGIAQPTLLQATPGAVFATQPGVVQARLGQPALIPNVQIGAARIATTQVSEDFDPNPQYSYSYDVQDGLTGDSKSHSETRNGDVVQGSYSLSDADGTRRTVEYTADPVNGFNAVVHKEPLTAAPVAKIAASAVVVH